jgi:cytochrome c-type biogenesis protein CcmH/NrfG
MALASLGIIEMVMGQDSLESRKKAIHLFYRAFQVNPRNPLALKYLAEHLFFKGEFK